MPIKQNKRQNSYEIDPEYYVFKLLKNAPSCQDSEIPGSTIVSFKPIQEKSGTSLRKAKCTSQIPRFNKDYVYYTPSFYNPLCETFHRSKLARKQYNDHKLMGFKTHLSKIQRNLEEQEELIPLERNEKRQFNGVYKNKNCSVCFNPGKEHYCNVCLEDITDYWQHVNLDSHIENIKVNQSNDYIHQLCSKYRIEEQVQPRRIQNMGSQKENVVSNQLSQGSATKSTLQTIKCSQFIKSQNNQIAEKPKAGALTLILGPSYLPDQNVEEIALESAQDCQSIWSLNLRSENRERAQYFFSTNSHQELNSPKKSLELCEENEGRLWENLFEDLPSIDFI